MKPTVYLAGPIGLGDQFVNTGRALVMADQLKQLGLTVFVPHWGALQQMYRPWTYDEWLTYDLLWLDKCDSLFRMSGESPGADKEVAHAKHNCLPVFYEDKDGITLITAWKKMRGISCSI